MIAVDEFEITDVEEVNPNPDNLSSDEYCLRVARLMSLTIFSPGLLRVPVVCLMSHSLVVTMSQKHSLIKSRYLEP